MRLLVVQTAFLGDVVLTTPLLRELRRVLPAAELCVLTTELGAQLLQGLPYHDRVLTYDKRWNRNGLRSYGRLLGALHRTRFDAAIAAHRSFRTGLLLLCSGATLRLGFKGAPGAWAYDRRIAWDPAKHAVERYLDLSVPLGGDPDLASGQPELAVEPAARRRVERLLRSARVDPDRKLLCIAPGSIWPTKRWPAAGYAKVVDAASSRGLVPLLIGSADDRGLCLEVARLASSPVAMLAGRTTISELLALLERSRALVGNDSGPAHIASAVGTPVVSIFGSTVPEQGYTAYGSQTWIVEQGDLDCRPCGRHGLRRCPLDHFRCMREVGAEEVLGQVDELLRSGGVEAEPLRIAEA